MHERKGERNDTERDASSLSKRRRLPARNNATNFLALNDALDELATLQPRKAQVVEMRYFGGLSNQEIADALDVSLATVKREWAVAKAWLQCELS